ncbi:STAS domain-containing protein [Nocardia sp. alder85J]|uniref:STAS domain-containing protein n=1 Tax=Nocardia sp. alder85J TaxID=2862949 RepID=UPI001CD35464|nr:STAS domain-containing protein [Nocardia sp. alder85J]MCX4095847.1 STAS domain-containing protein [Nocardia sp. alder85J]
MADDEVARLLTVSRSRSGDTVVVAAEGEIDVTSAPQLQAELEQAQDDGAAIVDLSRVVFMGSAGLSVLLAAAQRTGAGPLRVVASFQVRRPIEVTGLDKSLALFESLDEALRSQP